MSDALPDNDTALMQLASAGHRDAFETLVRRHQRPLLNFFLRAGVTSDAEDLVQQTFVRLYRYRNRYRPSAKFTTFLYLLARQVWIDEIRRRQRRRRLWERMAEQVQVDTQPARNDPPAGMTDALQHALDRLSPRLRDVITLGILQDLNQADVAEILHIPVGTVKSRMFNALRELRQHLKTGPDEHES